MKKIIIIVISFFITVDIYPQNDYLNSLVDSAIIQMDKGKLENSKELLETVISKDPNHYAANYELAYLYTQIKQYDKSITILKKIESSNEVSDRYYQLLGTIYDFKNMEDVAIEKYKEGLTKFPNSGRLHVELGMMYHKSNDIMKALETYEKGILVDPMFPSNYFYAGLVLLGSSEPVWGLMYGEIFMNLEPYTERSKTMSKYLFETIKSHVSLTDTAFVANFTEQKSLQFNQSSMSLEMSFPLLYQMCFNAAGRKAVEEGLDTLELYTLGKIHDYQVEQGLKYYNEISSNPLYNYLLEVRKAGFMEDYCMLLFKGGAPLDYLGWISMNKEHYLAFMKWREENKLQISLNNCFSRLTCKSINLSSL